jgi:uncharacterized protein YeaO (DUF488 family)
MNVPIKRVYEEPSAADGKRILIDRLWPRGLSKDRANVDMWLKDIAPTTELRKWFAHDAAKWAEFKKRYRNELASNSAARDALMDELKRGKVTLVYSASDESHNDAVVLKEYLEHAIS